METGKINFSQTYVIGKLEGKGQAKASLKECHISEKKFD